MKTVIYYSHTSLVVNLIIGMTYNSSFNLNFEPSNQEEMNNSHYNASVPIALYRQLTEELNITQTRLKFTEQENRKLAKENEELKRELANLLKQGEDLKEIVNKFDFTVSYPLDNTVIKIQNRTKENSNIPRAIQPINKKTKKINQTKLIEEISPANVHNVSVLKSKDSSSFLMAIALIFVILTTFGIGFIAIHALLGNSQSN
jgi:predicted RNase H-like nuclease (RuvC/YqgF family)